MEEKEILELYNSRSELAIAKTAEKYGPYLSKIAYNILCDLRDSEECVNDGYLKTWNTVPPVQPQSLKAYIGKIVRNLALDRYDAQKAAKRGGGQVPAALDELAECVASASTVESQIESSDITRILNDFLGTLSSRNRIMFVRRYWYMDSIDTVSELLGMSESAVKTALFRIRKDLAEALIKEGVEI